MWFKNTSLNTHSCTLAHQSAVANKNYAHHTTENLNTENIRTQEKLTSQVFHTGTEPIACPKASGHTKTGLIFLTGAISVQFIAFSCVGVVSVGSGGGVLSRARQFDETWEK